MGQFILYFNALNRFCSYFADCTQLACLPKCEAPSIALSQCAKLPGNKCFIHVCMLKNFKSNRNINYQRIRPGLRPDIQGFSPIIQHLKIISFISYACSLQLYFPSSLIDGFSFWCHKILLINTFVPSSAVFSTQTQWQS